MQVERLLAAAPELLDALARGFAAAGQDRHPPGPAAVASRPAEARVLAPRLSGVGIPAHRLPTFGPWLFQGVAPSLHLTGALSARAFRALATRSIRMVGGPPLTSGHTAYGAGRRLRSFTPASPRHAGAPARLRAVGRVIHP